MSDHLTLEYWPVSRLVPYDANPRRNDAVVDRMCDSIKEFGFRIPVLALSDGTVVDGHLRLKAALKIGMETVPVILADGLTPSQVRAFRIMANRSVSWAEWDDEILRSELADLHSLGFDVTLTGFDLKELKRLDIGLGKIPESADAVPLPDGDRYQNQYGVIVICKDESEQAATYERLQGEGFECRVVTT